MAAYAALVSLTHIIEQIQHHPRPPISLDHEQIESLTEKITFLQDFLEGYSFNGGSEDADALEGRIADAAYAAEDIIESHIVDQIQAGSTSTHVENTSGSTDFYQGLQEVIENMDFIKTEVAEIKQKLAGFQDQLLHRNSMSAGSSRSPPTGQNTMVGFDDVLIETMDKLTGQQSNRQIIPIVGMGGIGKTTLARNIYVNPFIKHHFDILAWATISQEYNATEILIQVLLCLSTQGSRESLSQMSEHKLGEILHKNLSGRRYLIVMDDIWSIEVWERVKFFFPDSNNGSRIMITTRLSDMGFQLSWSSNRIDMSFLDEDRSWNLLCKNIFGEESCPLELEEIGKKIANNCKGLPLSIVVIGGLLARPQRTRKHWEYIAENLNSIVNLEDNEHCLKILHMSYNQLPVHLKPCFLYMGVFPEDSTIRVSSLVKVWVAEGFLKPIHGKSMEMVAEEYLNELINRNLVLVDKLGSTGKMKTCKIHDLLRDLCLRKSLKERFLKVTKRDNISHDISTQRRICILQRKNEPNLFSTLLALPLIFNQQSVSLARSVTGKINALLPLSRIRLLRVWNAIDNNYRSIYSRILYNTRSREEIFQLVNLRYLAIRLVCYEVASFPYPVHLWNLQTLIVNLIQLPIVSSRSDSFADTPLFDIWKMPQLRHVKFDELDLLDPPMDGQDDFVLGNLQTLSKVRNFKCGEEVVKRIPNIKKLGLIYEEWSNCWLNNLGRLHRLESLGCVFSLNMRLNRSYVVQNLIFPHSLKKLSLRGSCLNWEDMKTTIGALPLLQVLKLRSSSFRGSEWETVEGQFQSLQFLLIDDCCDLEYWRTDSTHFPRLKHLVLRFLDKLKEIPSCIGEILTLQSIELEYCSESAVISARKILQEQEELGNVVDLQVRTQLFKSIEAVRRLESAILKLNLFKILGTLTLAFLWDTLIIWIS